MCGIVGYIGHRNATEIIVEGLRRLDAARRGQAGATSTSSCARAPVRDGRHRPHALGHPRPPLGGERAPARGRRRHRGAQRHHREPPRAQAPSSSAAATCSRARPTPRSSRTSSPATRAGSDLVHRGARALAGAGRVRAGGARREATPTASWWSPRTPRRSCWGSRRGRELRRLRRARAARHTRDVMFLEDGDLAVLTREGGISTIARRASRSSARPHASTGRRAWPRRAATSTSCTRRSTSSRGRSPTRCAAASPGATGDVHLDGWSLRRRRSRWSACGFSPAARAYHAGLVGKWMIESLARVPCEVELASEFRYRDPVVDQKPARVAISQSGETADTLAAIKEAKARGATTTLAVCNVIGSAIAREATSGAALYTHAGPEIGVASTKASRPSSRRWYLLAINLGAGAARSQRGAHTLLEEARRASRSDERCAAPSRRQIIRDRRRYHRPARLRSSSAAASATPSPSRARSS
jgi:glucosamine--fructose-6-phosphate aminotransferase (isomerizing)